MGWRGGVLGLRSISRNFWLDDDDERGCGEEGVQKRRRRRRHNKTLSVRKSARDMNKHHTRLSTTHPTTTPTPARKHTCTPKASKYKIFLH